jgi:hypothetical protein
LIKTANLFPKQTQDLHLHVIESFNEIMHLPLSSYPNAVKAFQQLAHPP